MNSNFASCQKESNELLHEDFTESKSPDILRGAQAPTLHKLRCLFPSSYTFTSFRSFSQGFISSWHTQKRERIPLLEMLKIYI